jgi:hypothetical protein
MIFCPRSSVVNSMVNVGRTARFSVHLVGDAGAPYIHSKKMCYNQRVLSKKGGIGFSSSMDTAALSRIAPALRLFSRLDAPVFGGTVGRPATACRFRSAVPRSANPTCAATRLAASCGSSPGTKGVSHV